jgi:signal transduction histidine kinase
MAAIDARAGEHAALDLGTDPAEARLVERGIAVARAVLAMSAVAVVQLDPTGPSHYVWVTTMLLYGYTAFAVILVIPLRRARSIPPSLPLFIHTVDIGFAAALTLYSEGPNSPFFTFLIYPLIAAAYRWGFREVMITACVVDALLGLEAVIVVNSAVISSEAGFQLNTFLLRAISVAATGAAVGYLGENEKRRRLEARAMGLVLGRARLGGKLVDTLNLVLTSVKGLFAAKQVLLVMQEQQSGRTWLWATDPTGRDEPIARPEQLSAERRDHYLFDTVGAAWHAAGGVLPWRRRRFAVVVLDEFGRQLPAAQLPLPKGFLASHPCRRLIGVSLRLSEEWTGRLFVLAPGYGVHREQSARFALRLANQVGPAVYGHYLVRRLRTRAQSLERGRIARELHDGVTQSLLGLEMELVVLRRRALVESPKLADDLSRAHTIVRNEVIAVRELLEGIRVGDVESHDLLTHLSEVVDRFSRHTGITARFVSDGQAVHLTPHVCRQLARILHEGLINVRKHSNARRVIVRGDRDGMGWRLSIEDDGRGFPFAGRVSHNELDALHQGPRTISERARLIGAVMTVESKPGFGARVEVAVPPKATS